LIVYISHKMTNVTLIQLADYTLWVRSDKVKFQNIPHGILYKKAKLEEVTVI